MGFTAERYLTLRWNGGDVVLRPLRLSALHTLCQVAALQQRLAVSAPVLSTAHSAYLAGLLCRAVHPHRPVPAEISATGTLARAVPVPGLFHGLFSQDLPAVEWPVLDTGG